MPSSARIRPVNELGTQGGAELSEKSPNFFPMSNSFMLCSTHFSSGGENFSRGKSRPIPPSYGPGSHQITFTVHQASVVNVSHPQRLKFK